MDKHREAFFEEAVELLADFEEKLIDLELHFEDVELLNGILRILHTLKGSGAMFGFDRLAEFVHTIENVYVKVRSKEIELNSNLIQNTLSSGDLINSMLLKEYSGGEIDESKASSLTDFFTQLTNLSQSTSEDAANSPKEPEDELQPDEFADFEVFSADNNETEALSDKVEANTDFASNSQKIMKDWYISFKPQDKFFFSGNDPLLLLNELKDLGEIETELYYDRVPLLNELDPENLYLDWKIKLTTEASEDQIRDVFIFVEDICFLDISLTPFKKQTPEKTSEIAVDSKLDPTINNSVQIDQLVQLLGELVTIQGRLSQRAENNSDTELRAVSQELEDLTSNFRDCVLKMTVIKIGALEAELERTISASSGIIKKDISFSFKGKETNIDRKILDEISTPFIDFIYAMASECFGNESLSGEPGFKPKVGVVARQIEGSVCLLIENNGISFDKLAFAGELAEDLSGKRNQAYDPGFLAGKSKLFFAFYELRKTLTQLQGDIEIELLKNRIAITLPLNLAIIEGLMVKIEDGLFLLPLEMVEECIELSVEDQKKNYGKDIVIVRGQLVPYIKLREIFQIKGTPPPIQQIAISYIDGKKIGFVVDQVLGEWQTTIKSWGRFCSEVQGISGASILGDGSIALIVNLQELVKESTINGMEAEIGI